MNRNKRRTAGVAALALALVATAVIGFARGREDFGGGRGRGGDRRGGFGHVFRSVDLTEAQRTRIRQIAERHRQNITDLREQLRAGREGGADVLNGGTFNEPAVRSAAQARAAVGV